jgi:hypothetical protein
MYDRNLKPVVQLRTTVVSNTHASQRTRVGTRRLQKRRRLTNPRVRVGHIRGCVEEIFMMKKMIWPV